tara:strand:- start:226 stop:384 length:159 start_codon:yes stop_codon:yes gene_type:complete
MKTSKSTEKYLDMTEFNKIMEESWKEFVEEQEFEDEFDRQKAEYFSQKSKTS